MYRVIECLTQEHSFWLVAVAAIVCVVGSSLSVTLLRRVLIVKHKIRTIQVAMAGAMTGATIWATHFIAMVAYDPGLPHAYEPILTAVSLVIAVLGALGANFTMAYMKTRTRFVFAGIMFGITVSAMHYVGMSAYVLPGTLDWHATTVFVSICLGAGFGAITYHRIAYPWTRYCTAGGITAMVLGICTMHFVGMGAFSISLSPLYDVPDQVFSDHILGLIVILVALFIFIMGYAALNIEQGLSQHANQQMQSAAMKDILTNLPNRHALHLALETWTTALKGGLTDHVAVYTVNIDAFKHINELYGTASGDIVLSKIAQRIGEELQHEDTLFRAGGDEFVIVSRGFRRMGQVTSMADRISAYLKEPLNVGDNPILVTSSMGVSSSLQDGRDMDTLLQNSGIAMFYAKANPDVNVQIFDADMQKQSRARLEIQTDLRQAAARGELELVYQKQNELPSRDLIGFEVLLRWNHPTRGRVSPVEFIPIAEETGLIRDIGLWVLRTACEEAVQWPIPLSIAVNVAPQQLVQPSFIESVSDILFETRLAPERLELEITEASIIDDENHTLRVMHRLKAMGLRIAMDDFGTGYSSLSTLQSFPFDKIKMDRSFVQEIHINPKRAAIAKATMLIGNALQIPVLAEGTEVEEELIFLEDAGCAYVQGFYFGTPLPLTDLHNLLAGIAQKEAS
ncbi:EAL domain-containing protein [Ascidiaceihabitans sp.]|uniref:putative bifunctional diguanylate cyclase/phosphodiesterase n=1 Tax=Ascidiaceihabitans sp. TaxID=1872644 RepID=UPI00329704E6